MGGVSLYFIYVNYTTCIISQYDLAFYISLRSTILLKKRINSLKGEGWGTFKRSISLVENEQN